MNRNSQNKNKGSFQNYFISDYIAVTIVSIYYLKKEKDGVQTPSYTHTKPPTLTWVTSEHHLQKSTLIKLTVPRVP